MNHQSIYPSDKTSKMRNKFVDGEAESESMSFARSSSPDSFTERSFASHSTGTMTPNTATVEDAVLFDADELDKKKQRGQHRDQADEAYSSKNFRDHSPVPRDETRCSILPRRLAMWSIAGNNIKLSALAAAVLINEGKLNASDLEVFGGQDEVSEKGPSDPISGIVAATHSTVGGVVMGIVDYPVEINKMMQSDREVAKTLATDFALDSGKGISRIIGTGLRAPMDFTMNISKGFGNVPKLYGDDTVRRSEKVTGIDSGLEAGMKGFGFGLYDGVTGLFTQPVKGAQEGGVGGFFMGLGKGIGGAICKPAAGAVGLPAYALKGIFEEIQSVRGVSTEDNLRTKLVKQGQEEWEMCTVDERAAILGKWYEF